MDFKDLDASPEREPVDENALRLRNACWEVASDLAGEISEVLYAIHYDNNDEITDKQKFVIQSRFETILDMVHKGAFDGLWTPLSPEKFALYADAERKKEWN